MSIRLRKNRKALYRYVCIKGDSYSWLKYREGYSLGHDRISDARGNI